MSVDANTQAPPHNVRRCHATILFADVCSSTQLAEICDPESLAEILFQVRSTAEKVVSDHHGVINQFYGDGILAAFGFPVPHENDVLRATEAALSLNRAIAALSLKRYLPKGFKLRLHTGVHAGLIVVQDGDRLQGQYKLYGDALNTAARLADAAEEGEVFASEATLRGVLPYFEVERLPPLQLKGKGASLPAFRVLRRTGIQTRYEASLSKGLTPFVGRRFEMGELQQRLSMAAEGHLQTVKVTGDAGLGKTRLIEEFLSGLDENVLLIRSHCDRDNRAVPLYPFVQIVRHCLNLGSATLTTASIEWVDQSIQALGESVANYADSLKKILSLSPQDRGSQLGPDAIAEAIAALLTYDDSQSMRVIFVDDWHWVDDLSRQVMSELVRILGESATLVLLASRHEKLSDKTLRATGFSLDPFTLGESREAVASLFLRAVQPDMADAIHSRSGGNALFVEELCQTLIAETDQEENALAEVPATLHGLIESRLEHLQAEQEEVIRAAAVIGDLVPCWLLEQVIGYRLPKDLIVELAHRDLLYFSNDREHLHFKHGLTRDVIYESVTLRDRQALHHKVAEILQKRADDSGVDDHFEALAYHYDGAGDDEKTLKYAELAGNKAMVALSLDRARLQFQAAMEAMDRLDCIDKRFDHWNLLAQRFGWNCVFDPLPEQIELLERTIVLSEQFGDARSLAKSEFWLAYVNYSLGRADEAIRYFERSLAGARATDEKGLEIHALSTLAQSLASRSDYQRALACFDEVSVLRGLREDSAERSIGSAYAIACRALIFADQGDFIEAEQQLDIALKSVDGADAEVEGSIWAVCAASRIWKGDFQGALESANNASECARNINNTFVLGMGTALGGYSQWRINGDVESLDNLIAATDWLEQKSKNLFISVPYGLLCAALIETGNYDGVRHYAARALWRARHGDRLGEAMAYRALAKLSQRQTDKPMRSFDHYLDGALASAQLRESRRERAVTMLARAELIAERDPEMAQSLVDNASAEFSAMGLVLKRLQRY